MLLLSTATFPNIFYCALLMKSAKASIEIFETYPRQTWRNRYQVVTGNGLVNLSVPVNKPEGNHTMTRDVLLSNHDSWKQNHWKTIYSAYRNAPFFLYYSDLVKDLLFSRESDLLYRFNDRILRGIFSELEIDAKWEFTAGFEKSPEGALDLRHVISPKNKDPETSASGIFKPYYQVFDARLGFQENTSIIDLIFNLGPDATSYLSESDIRFTG